jgi:hypothetical protein
MAPERETVVPFINFSSIDQLKINCIATTKTTTIFKNSHHKTLYNNLFSTEYEGSEAKQRNCCCCLDHFKVENVSLFELRSINYLPIYCI